MDHNVHHEGEYSETEIIAQILDAFKENSQYLKTRTMYFDFRNLGERESHYLAASGLPFIGPGQNISQRK